MRIPSSCPCLEVEAHLVERGSGRQACNAGADDNDSALCVPKVLLTCTLP